MDVKSLTGVDAAALAEVLFVSSPVGVAITDVAGRLVDANPALCALLDRGRDELIGVWIADLTHAQDRVQLVGALGELGGAGEHAPVVLEHRWITAGGHAVWARTTAVVARISGGHPQMVVEVEDLSERYRLEATIRHMGTHDELTGLANREVFYGRLRARLGNRRRAARSLAVLVVNLNRFQQVNAGLGHVDADLVLAEVARRMVAGVRRQDTVARLGGDWFAVMAPGVTTPEDAVELGVALRQRIGEAYWAGGNAVFVSARVGVVTAPAHGNDAVTLVRRATSATEEAKTMSSGWAMPSRGEDRAAQEVLGLVSDLRSAIEADALDVAYQPIVDADGQVHCVEALARWTHPVRGAVPPDQFIALAEKNELISVLTDRLLRRAVEQAVRWRADIGPVGIAVNLSGRLVGQPGLVAKIDAALASAELPPSALTLEITETAVATGSHTTVRGSLQALRDLGVRISIDDFGTGYSSLSYLKELPVDELKIDRSFIAGLEQDPRTERIVRSITDLAHSLDLMVVAEGVEHEAMASLLLRLGADHLQGYAIARPADAGAVTDWLHHNTPSDPARQSTRTGNRQLQVLVVDHHRAARHDLRQRLHDRDHRVIEARSGQAALTRLHQHMPDLIILDDLLPGHTGVETAPQLRAAGYLGPILLYSGSPPEDLAAITYPLDVWPVSKSDEHTLMRLIDGYACSPSLP